MRTPWLLVVLVSSSCGEGVLELSEHGQASVRAALSTRLRIVAGNLTSGTGQSYDPGHGARIFDGLDPDVVLIQEFNASSVPAFVTNTFGAGFSSVRGAATEQIPNGVISRYPIKASGTWADARVNGTRGFTWALIDVPGPTDLFAVSVHFSTSNATTRQAEATALVTQLRATAPAGSWVVVGGDLNTNSRTEAALSTLRQVVVTSGPWPVDRASNGNTNASRSKPYDWLLVSGDLQAKQVPCVVGPQSFPNGLVADTRVFTPISALSPALSGDSGASGMQHMAVVRDFVIDGDATPPPPPPPPPSGTARVIINEVLANEPGTDVTAEFVELLNVGDASAELGGWTLSDATAQRHVFPPGTTLAAGQALVVTGANASSGTLALSNGSDSVTLTAAGQALDSVSWTSSVDGVSVNRSPDGTAGAPLVLHTTLASQPSSAGTRVDGTAF